MTILTTAFHNNAIERRQSEATAAEALKRQQAAEQKMREEKEEREAEEQRKVAADMAAEQEREAQQRQLEKAREEQTKREEESRRAEKERSAKFEQERLAALREREQEEAKRREAVIKTLADALNKVASGNLSIRLYAPFDDAYEQLRQDFNHAVAKLTASFGTIASNSSLIHEGARGLQGAAETLHTRTQQQTTALQGTTRSDIYH